MLQSQLSPFLKASREIARLFELMTGRAPTPEEMAEAENILRERPAIAMLASPQILFARLAVLVT